MVITLVDTFLSDGFLKEFEEKELCYTHPRSVTEKADVLAKPNR